MPQPEMTPEQQRAYDEALESSAACRCEQAGMPDSSRLGLARPQTLTPGKGCSVDFLSGFPLAGLEPLLNPRYKFPIMTLAINPERDAVELVAP